MCAELRIPVKIVAAKKLDTLLAMPDTRHQGILLSCTYTNTLLGDLLYVSKLKLNRAMSLEEECVRLSEKEEIPFASTESVNKRRTWLALDQIVDPRNLVRCRPIS